MRPLRGLVLLALVGLGVQCGGCRKTEAPSKTHVTLDGLALTLEVPSGLQRAANSNEADGTIYFQSPNSVVRADPLLFVELFAQRGLTLPTSLAEAVEFARKDACDRATCAELGREDLKNGFLVVFQHDRGVMLQLWHTTGGERFCCVGMASPPNSRASKLDDPAAFATFRRSLEAACRSVAVE